MDRRHSRNGSRSPRRTCAAGARWLAGSLLLLLPSPAKADGFESVPTGSRTAALGGAGIAGGWDSAMPTLNPAGLSRIPGSIASISASLYQVGTVQVPGFIADGDRVASRWGDLAVSQQGVNSTEFSSFPSGIAYFLHLGSAERPTVLAASLSAPERINRRFVQNAEFLGDGVSVKDNITTIIQDHSYVGAFSWASKFGPVHVGASALLSYASLLRNTDRSDLVVLGSADFTRTQTKETMLEHSIDTGALIGVQVDATPWLRLGATVRSPSIHLSGGFEGSVDHTAVRGNADPFVSTMQQQGDSVHGFPMRFGLGVEVVGERYGLALDGSLYLPRNDEYRRNGVSIHSDIGTSLDRPDSQIAMNQVMPTRTVVNLALGGEYEVMEGNWLRAGVFTDFASGETAEQMLATAPGGSRPPPSMFFRFPIDRYGASAGWGTRLGPVDTTIGARVAFGSGETLRIDPNARFTDNARVEMTRATSFEAIAFATAVIDFSESASALMETVNGGNGGFAQ